MGVGSNVDRKVAHGELIVHDENDTRSAIAQGLEHDAQLAVLLSWVGPTHAVRVVDGVADVTNPSILHGNGKLSFAERWKG
jgi:hypothetical protein